MSCSSEIEDDEEVDVGDNDDDEDAGECKESARYINASLSMMHETTRPEARRASMESCRMYETYPTPRHTRIATVAPTTFRTAHSASFTGKIMSLMETEMVESFFATTMRTIEAMMKLRVGQSGTSTRTFLASSASHR